MTETIQKLTLVNTADVFVNNSCTYLDGAVHEMLQT